MFVSLEPVVVGLIEVENHGEYLENKNRSLALKTGTVHKVVLC